MRNEFMKKLIKIVIPIAFQQLMLSLVSVSDAIMLGRLSQNSLAAVSLASQVSFVENLFLAAMTIGFSIFGAQYWGKKDKEAFAQIFAYVMKVTISIAFLFFLAAACIPQRLMQIFTNDRILLKGGTIYLRVVSSAYLLTGISQIYLCMLKNSGRSSKSSVISSASVFINIILNAVFIFGFIGFPQMGIAGAALATVIARFIEVLWCIFETAKGDCIKLPLQNVGGNNRAFYKNFWKYTNPVLANEIIWGIGFTMYSVIMGHLGTDAVAANSIANIVKNLAACFCLGIGSGGSIIIGNELGAGDLETAKVYGRKLCHASIVSGVISGILILLLMPVVLVTIELSPEAEYYLKWMLVMCAYYMIGKSVNSTVIAGIFCAGGDSRFGLFCDSAVMWCMVVPVGFIAAFLWDLPVLVVYFILSLDEMLKLPAVYKHFQKYKWVNDLTQKEGVL